MVNFRSEIEVWKPIPGYEGLYEASSQGRIRTAEGKTTSSARFDRRVWQQRIMKQKWHNRKGGKKADARVCLWKDGKEKTLLVSRLVAMSFLPAPYDKLTVNHIDGNPANNRLDNLEWCTLQENIKHAFDTGLQRKSEKAVILAKTDGSELHFKSMNEANRYLGRGHGYVSEAIARGYYCYGKDGVKYLASLAEDGDARDP